MAGTRRHLQEVAAGRGEADGVGMVQKAMAAGEGAEEG